MIIDCRSDYDLFKMESYYFPFIECNVYNRNTFYVHALLQNSVISIVQRSEYL